MQQQVLELSLSVIGMRLTVNEGVSHCPLWSKSSTKQDALITQQSTLKETESHLVTARPPCTNCITRTLNRKNRQEVKASCAKVHINHLDLI